MGVWIETIPIIPRVCDRVKSLPAWECGLKLLLVEFPIHVPVTPRVGVWIETPEDVLIALISLSHSPRGSVD